MVHYPQQYHAETVANAEVKEVWEAVTAENRTKCSIPTAYDGSGEAFSPEEFFLLSLQNCFIASFKVYAHHMDLAFDRISVSADLIVDLKDDAGPVMDSVEMVIELFNTTDEDKARYLIDKSIQDGFIFNSIKTRVTTRIEFH